VGPYALLPELRRSQKVLSTAIVFFRRFFLSNSVIECNPRKIAAAAALFAAKAEEEKIEVRSESSSKISISSSNHRPVRRNWWIERLCKYPTNGKSVVPRPKGRFGVYVNVPHRREKHHRSESMTGLVTFL
jgi:hypothetical protein